MPTGKKLLWTSALVALTTLGNAGAHAAKTSAERVHDLRTSFGGLKKQASTQKMTHLSEGGFGAFAGVGLGIDGGVLTRTQNGKTTYAITLSPSFLTGRGVGATTQLHEEHLDQQDGVAAQLPLVEKRTTKLEWGYPLGANGGDGTMKGIGKKASATSGRVDNLVAGLLAYKTRTDRRVNLRLPLLRLPSKGMRLVRKGERLLVRIEKAIAKGKEEKVEALLEEAASVHTEAQTELAR